MRADADKESNCVCTDTDDEQYWVISADH
jgi:hypothetical protein